MSSNMMLNFQLRCVKKIGALLFNRHHRMLCGRLTVTQVELKVVL